MSELLKIDNISFHYHGNKHFALNNVSASFRAGERIAVLGGNGAGKSTFFLCCNGILRPQSGKIFYKGQEISSKKDIFVLRQGVGLVFQDPDSQIIAGSVESEVSFGPINLRLSADEVLQRVEQSLEQMNISKYRDQAPQYLSGGEKKRVSIADILAMRPEVILLDEPTASLDPQNVDALEKTLDELSSKGIAIIVSTHDVNFAYKIADRAVVFAHGEIIADAPVDDVFASESTLKEAGLKKPLLYEAFEILQHKMNHKKSALSLTMRKPKTIEEFYEYIDFFSE
jgi:cobalt/nickel transport system ATP-binding protein